MVVKAVQQCIKGLRYVSSGKKTSNGKLRVIRVLQRNRGRRVLQRHISEAVSFSQGSSVVAVEPPRWCTRWGGAVCHGSV